MKENIQKRLICFATLCILVKKQLNGSFEADHLSKQLIRSSTSAALNYGEARSAESRKDFIHKQGLCLKELRESHINLQIIEQNNLCMNQDLIQKSIDEANQLVSIFVTSVRSSQRNSP
jgi:four helix bundle protein